MSLQNKAVTSHTERADIDTARGCAAREFISNKKS